MNIELLEIDKLIEKREFDRALEMITSLDMNALDNFDKINLCLLQSKIFNGNADYVKSLEMSQKAFNEAKEHNEFVLQIEALNLKLFSYWFMSKTDEALNAGLDAKRLIDNLSEEEININARKHYKTFMNIGILYQKRGEYNESSRYLERSLGIAEYSNDEMAKSTILHVIGVNHKNTGNLDLALDFCNESMEIAQKEQDHLIILEISNSIALIKRIKGDFDEALFYFHNMISIYKEHGMKNKVLLAGAYSNIGEVLYQKGNYIEAMEYYHSSLEISKELQFIYGIALTKNNIALVYFKTGEIDLSIAKIEEAVDLMKQLKIKDAVAGFQINLGLAYIVKGDLEKAKEYLNSSLISLNEEENETFTDTINGHLGDIARLEGKDEEALDYYLKTLNGRKIKGNKIQIAVSLLQLTLYHKSTGDIDELGIYYAMAVKYKIEDFSKTGKLFYDIIEAIYLKSKQDNKKIERSQDILESILDKDIIDITVSFLAMFNLAEIYLIKYRKSLDTNLLISTRKIVKRMQIITKEQGLIPEYINANILQSKLLILEYNVDDAKEILDESFQISKNKGLVKLNTQCSSEIKNLNNTIEKWDRISKNAISLEEKYIESQIMTYIEERGSDRGIQPHFKM